MSYNATCSEVHAFANEMLINCASAEVIKISQFCLEPLSWIFYAVCRGQVHVKTVSHVFHRLEIAKPIQSLKKAGNL